MIKASCKALIIICTSPDARRLPASSRRPADTK
jgi:hypothetical protein